MSEQIDLLGNDPYIAQQQQGDAIRRERATEDDAGCDYEWTLTAAGIADAVISEARKLAAKCGCEWSEVAEAIRVATVWSEHQ